MAHRKTLKRLVEQLPWHTGERGRDREPRSIRHPPSAIRLGIALAMAHVPAICIAVCLNCVNRPKLRISFGFNLKNLLCFALLCSQTASASLVSTVRPLPVASICLFKRCCCCGCCWALRKWFYLPRLATWSRYIHAICDVAVTNWPSHWLPIRSPSLSIRCVNPGPVLSRFRVTWAQLKVRTVQLPTAHRLRQLSRLPPIERWPRQRV